MHLFVLAATLAVAFAAPQITSSGNDITVTGKSIKFSEVRSTPFSLRHSLGFATRS
jgi:hypothetical protein